MTIIVINANKQRSRQPAINCAIVLIGNLGYMKIFEFFPFYSACFLIFNS